MGAGRQRPDGRRQQPCHRSQDRHRAEVGQGRDPPRHRSRRGSFQDLAQDDRARALEAAAQAARRDDGQSGRTGRTADHRAGQVAVRIEGGDRLGRVLHIVVRRGRSPHLWRRRAVAMGGPPHPGDQGAGWRHRRHHAVEFSVLDAGPQARPGARRRLHRRGQACVADAVFGSRLGRARRGSRVPQGRRQHPDRFGQRDRRRDLRQSAGVEDHFHRLDRGRQASHPEVVGHRQEGVDGTRRQRAVHRFRRRRPRACRRRRHHRQVPQFRPDLRLHQPLPCPGRCL